MSQVLRMFDEPIRDESSSYHARVLGRLATDDMWEGWLEFAPMSGSGPTLVSPVESRQPEYVHLAYWASGLTVVYAEGALERARRANVVRTRVLEPAPDDAIPRLFVAVRRSVAGLDPVLDPFEVGSRSLDILAQELRALGRARLMNIINGYDLKPAGLDLQQMTDAQLITLIVRGVEAAIYLRNK